MSTDSCTSRRASQLDPLIGALALLTAVSGVSDAISFLGLGHVFVANMTGNVVFLGFAAAGAAQLSVAASLVALAGFLLGSLEGGRLARRFTTDRSGCLRRALLLQFVAVAAATVIASAAGDTGDVVLMLAGAFTGGVVFLDVGAPAALGFMLALIAAAIALTSGAQPAAARLVLALERITILREPARRSG